MKNTIKIIALICAVTLLFTSCGSTVSTQTVKLKEPVFTDAQFAGDEFHKANVNAYEFVCKSGLIEMLFDKTTMTVAIRDTNSGNVWSTLPESTVTKQLDCSALEITLSNGDGHIYTLNSQDNSLNFGNANYTIGDEGVSVKYALALDAQTGKSDINELKDKEIRADLTVIYTLRDGSFYVNVSMNTLALPKGVKLESVRVLGDFGGYETSGAEDYIFVPDGSGALIMTGVEDENFSPISLSVYGNDLAISDNREKSTCLVGTFGMKRGNGAFLCIIEQGDAIAEINADRNGENTLNTVSATFNTTDIYTKTSKSSTHNTYGAAYKNEIMLCYRFLSGKSATYSGLASACRENLIRNSVLSTKSVEPESKNLPLVVSLQGGYKNSKGKYSALSTFEQAQDLMALLKAKGVNNAYLRYNGLYEDANNGSNDDFGDFSKQLGSKSDYTALYNYLASQKFSLFIDTDVLTFDYSASNNAQSIKNKDIKSSKNASALFPAPVTAQSFLAMNSVEKRVEDILHSSADVSFDGYALNDAASYLYSDYSNEFYGRTTSAKEIGAQLPVLATSKKIMVDTGNFYGLKTADIVTEIPLSPATRPENDAYVGIPFIQMMLHGICEYSGSAINGYEDMNTAFLKSVEYGCLPNVEWYCTAYSEELDGKYYYDKNINDVVSLYVKANSALSNVRDARMTSHSEIQPDVYCTEYNNSMKVYVNYTEEAVTINGITINANDCVAIS